MTLKPTDSPDTSPNQSELQAALEMSNGNYHRGILNLARLADTLSIETRDGITVNVNKGKITEVPNGMATTIPKGVSLSETILKELRIRTVVGTLNGTRFIFRPPISGKQLLPPLLSFVERVELPQGVTAEDHTKIIAETTKTKREVRAALTDALKDINYVEADNLD